MKRVEFVMRVVVDVPEDTPVEGLLLDAVELHLSHADEDVAVDPADVRWVSELSRRLRRVGSPVLGEFTDDDGWVNATVQPGAPAPGEGDGKDG